MINILKTQPNLVILQIPVSRLTKAHPDLDNKFFTQVLKDVPDGGKICEDHYIINTTLTLENPENLLFIQIFNVFLHQLRRRGTAALMLTK